MLLSRGIARRTIAHLDEASPDRAFGDQRPPIPHLSNLTLEITRLQLGYEGKGGGEGRAARWRGAKRGDEQDRVGRAG